MHGAKALPRAVQYAACRPVLLYAIFLGALLLRCWPRLVSPQVWAEDGSVVLAGFIADGWWTFFAPVNGYWQLVDKSISAAALSVSLYYYPTISIVLTCLFAAAVGLAVALAPTTLRGRFACALALFLVPTDAEVFGLPLYAFWWAGVLLLLLASWQRERSDFGWRLVFLLVGGLSSPLIVLVLPVLYLRALRQHATRAERWLASIATPVALLQIAFLLHSTGPSNTSVTSAALHVVPKFFGGFLVGNLGATTPVAWLAGLVSIGCIALWLRRDANNPARGVLSYLLLGVIALSVVRFDPALLSTFGAGPRYFFYPFVVLAWMLVQLYCATDSLALRGFVGAVGLVAVANLLPVLTRFHVDLQWHDHLRSCRQFPTYPIPVEVDGRQLWPGWDIVLRGSDCDRLLRRDWLAPRLEAQATFAYTVRRADWLQRDARATVLTTTMTGADAPSTARDGYRIVGSHDSHDSHGFQGAQASTGSIRLRLQRGASFLYRSGPDKAGQQIVVEAMAGQFLAGVPPTADWVRLTFANAALPEEFVVEIRDDGAGDGQWSAVALPEAGIP